MQSPRTTPRVASPREFQIHYQLAQEFRNSGCFADAVYHFQWALQTSGGREEDRLKAKILLGEMFLHLGHHPEALEAYSVVFQETWHRPQFHRFAYPALFQSIAALRWLQLVQGQEEDGPLQRRLTLLEEGFRWLRAIGKESWRRALLHHKAFALWDLGAKAAALEEAEAAFQLYREPMPGICKYFSEVHCEQVANFAYRLGEYQRGLQAIDALEGRYSNPQSEVRVLSGRAFLLLALDPPQAEASQVAARRAAHLAKEIQIPWIQLRAYVALGQSTLALTHFRQAEEALRQAYLIAMEDTTSKRPYLLREARQACQEAQGRLATGTSASRAQKLKHTVERILFVHRSVSEPASRAQKLKRTLEQWGQELDQAFLHHSSQVSEGEG